MAAVERVEVRTDAADGVGAAEGVAGRAVAREELAAGGGGGVELGAARALRRVVLAVGDEHQDRQAEAEHEDHEPDPEALRAAFTAGLGPGAGGWPAAAHRRQDDRKAD